MTKSKNQFVGHPGHVYRMFDGKSEALFRSFNEPNSEAFVVECAGLLDNPSAAAIALEIHPRAAEYVGRLTQLGETWAVVPMLPHIVPQDRPQELRS